MIKWVGCHREIAIFEMEKNEWDYPTINCKNTSFCACNLFFDFFATRACIYAFVLAGNLLSIFYFPLFIDIAWNKFTTPIRV